MTNKNILIVLGGFEPPSSAPKAERIDHYPTGLCCFVKAELHKDDCNDCKKNAIIDVF